MSGVQSFGALAAGLGWGAIDGVKCAGEWAATEAGAWYAPIGAAISPVTGPLANYGWMATAASTGLIFVGVPFGVNRAVNAFESARDGETKQAVTDGLLAAGSLAVVGFEVYALSLQFFGGNPDAGTSPV